MGVGYILVGPATLPMAAIAAAGHAIGVVKTADSAAFPLIFVGATFGTWFIIIFAVILTMAQAAVFSKTRDLL